MTILVVLRQRIYVPLLLATATMEFWTGVAGLLQGLYVLAFGADVAASDAYAKVLEYVPELYFAFLALLLGLGQLGGMLRRVMFLRIFFAAAMSWFWCWLSYSIWHSGVIAPAIPVYLVISLANFANIFLIYLRERHLG